MSEFVYDNVNESFEAASDDCIICKGTKKYEQWIACDSCRNWFHPKCLGMKKAEIPKPSEDWECINCKRVPPSVLQEVDNDNIIPIASDNMTDAGESSESDKEDADATEDRTQIAHEDVLTDSSIETDDEGNSQIRKIISYRGKKPHRKFLVQYQSNRETEWYRENELENCGVLLEAFCVKNNIELPEFIIQRKENGTFGASSNEETNKNNWASLTKIIEVISTYGLKNSVTPVTDSQLTNEDQIILYGIGDHCFVLLHLAKENECFLADGQNTFTRDKPIRQIILTKVKGTRKLTIIPFVGQLGVDHCSSSAAIIAIAFQRTIGTRIIPDEIRGPVKLTQQIKSLLHKSQSKSLAGKKSVSEWKWKIQCPKCGQGFKSKSRAVLNFHICKK